MSWWVVVNPFAGKRDDLAGRTRRAFAARDLEAEIHVTRDGDHVGEVVERGVAEGYGRFATVGGDGTVNYLLNALMGHTWQEPPVLGILPAGTGSDFVRMFGISQSMDRAVDHLSGDGTYRCDVGVIEGEWGTRYFLNEAQVGVGAAAARVAHRFSIFGPTRYNVAFWFVLPTFPIAALDLEVGGKRLQVKGLDVVFANGQFFAGGMNIAPKASVIDGLVDAQVFAASKRQALTIFPRVIKGTHGRHPSVRRMTGSEFAIDTDPPWPVEVDGEYVGSTPLRGRMLRGAIDLKI